MASNPSPYGTNVGLSNPVTLAQGGSGQTTQGGLFAAAVPKDAQPTGTLAFTVGVNELAQANLSAPTTTGTVCVNGIALPKGLTTSNIMILTGSTPAATPTHSWAALLDSTLHVLAVSADKLTGALAASTPVTYAMGAAFTTTAEGLYYIAFSSTAGVTAPTLSGLNSITAATALTPVPFGTAGTQTTPPALAAQLASGTVTGNANANFAAWIS